MRAVKEVFVTNWTSWERKNGKFTLPRAYTIPFSYQSGGTILYFHTMFFFLFVSKLIPHLFFWNILQQPYEVMQILISLFMSKFRFRGLNRIEKIISEINHGAEITTWIFWLPAPSLLGVSNAYASQWSFQKHVRGTIPWPWCGSRD